MDSGAAEDEKEREKGSNQEVGEWGCVCACIHAGSEGDGTAETVRVFKCGQRQISSGRYTPM